VMLFGVDTAAATHPRRPAIDFLLNALTERPQ